MRVEGGKEMYYKGTSGTLKLVFSLRNTGFQKYF